MILAENIALCRGNKTIFEPASFRFDSPEFVAIIGPNGAGKSTLLQLLSGYFPPSAGSVTIHKKQADKWQPNELARLRAYLQQQQSVFESFSVEDVLMMGRSIYMHSHPKNLDQELVTDALTNLNLVHRKNEPFNQFSGGEQQRIQFARTLLQLDETGTESLVGKTLFLDEPLNNLDLYYQYNLLQMARERVVNRGGTVIAVLHDLNMVYQFADRVIVLSGGKTLIDSPTEEAMVPELLSTIYQLTIKKIQLENQLPYFAVMNLSTSQKQIKHERELTNHY